VGLILGEKMINRPVLVLNQNYEPINVCRVRRAIVLLYHGKAEMLEDGVGFIQSAHDAFPVPSVIRLANLIRRPRPVPRLTRTEIFRRDHYTCQYCGKKVKPLTVDHVIPRFQNGKHVWENVVSACVSCNRHKAGRTPSEAGMRLIHPPSRPSYTLSFITGYDQSKTGDEWLKYLPPEKN
jgi:5-methylcytosine-specific restriction endonuclease McrA